MIVNRPSCVVNISKTCDFSVSGVNCSLSSDHSDTLDALIPRWIDKDNFNSKVVWLSDWLVRKNLMYDETCTRDNLVRS